MESPKIDCPPSLNQFQQLWYPSFWNVVYHLVVNGGFLAIAEDVLNSTHDIFDNLHVSGHAVVASLSSLAKLSKRQNRIKLVDNTVFIFINKLVVQFNEVIQTF